MNIVYLMLVSLLIFFKGSSNTCLHSVTCIFRVSSSCENGLMYSLELKKKTQRQQQQQQSNKQKQKKKQKNKTAL